METKLCKYFNISNVHHEYTGQQKKRIFCIVGTVFELGFKY